MFFLKSVKWKILILIACIVTASLASFAFIFYKTVQAFERHQIDEIKGFSAIMARQLSRTDLVDTEEMQKIINFVLNKYDMVYSFTIFNNTTTILASTFEPDIGSRTKSEDHLQTLKDGVLRIDLFKEKKIKTLARVTAPILKEGGNNIIGGIEITYHMEAYDRAIENIKKVSLFAIVIFVLAALVFAFFISSAITQPLLFLKEGLSGVAGGNLDLHLPAGRDDEFGEVVRAFNRMTSDLKASTDARRNMAGQLMKAKEEWEETFDTINDAITIHDGNFTVVRANRAAARLLGLQFDRLIGQRCFRLYHGMDGPPEHCPVFRNFGKNTPLVMDAFEPHLNRHLEIKALPRLDKNSRVVGSIHVVRDITDRKKAEEEQQELQAQLLQAQKMDSIGHLTGGIAHDFNNSLTAILGYCELALMDIPEGHPLAEKLRIILDAGNKASDLTKQLLAFSRKQLLAMRVVSLNDAVASMSKIFSRVIGENISLEIRTSRTMKNVLADPGQLEQVLMNLTINARDAMPAGGRLIIETDTLALDEEYARRHEGVTPGEYGMLSVADTGTGMSKEVCERIFEPFFTTKGKGKGTGLGLATVYGIIKQHYGHIWVYSEIGKGTTFKIYLPVTHESAARTSAPEEPAGMPGGNETVLVADDEESIKKLLAQMLEPLGYRVMTASSGEEALQIGNAVSGRIDVLLTDIIMPSINGKELADKLRVEHEDMKIIFMSGYPDDVIAHHGILEPGVNFIQKPITVGALTRKLRDVLDGRPGKDV